jgi:hypothetical protein
MKTAIHAAPLGLDNNLDAIGYKQAAPPELSTRHQP